jgi:hypothetical protein
MTLGEKTYHYKQTISLFHNFPSSIPTRQLCAILNFGCCPIHMHAFQHDDVGE